jgi:glutathionylspermidine synthase
MLAKVIETYEQERDRFYAPLREDFWPELPDKEDKMVEYSLYQPRVVTQDVIDEVRNAAYFVGKVYEKLAPYSRQFPDQVLKALDIPEQALDYVRLKTLSNEAVIARADVVLTKDGPKVIEINWDTPTFIQECFRINDLICKEHGLKSPNTGEDKNLFNAVRKMIHEAFDNIGGIGEPNVVFTAHHEHKEDWGTVSYLQKGAGIGKCVGLEFLQITEDELLDPDGNKIDILYRQTYPIEHLVEDRDEYGNEIGVQLMKLVEQGKLAILNPPSSFLHQTKAMQAVIWDLAQHNNDLFTEEEKGWIKKYMLPTYLTPDKFFEKRTKFVRKPSYGREGDTVSIIDANNTVVFEDAQKNYEQSVPVYQHCIDMEEGVIETLNGFEKTYQMFGCFLINGEASAIGVRADVSKITGNASYFLPVAVK